MSAARDRAGRDGASRVVDFGAGRGGERCGGCALDVVGDGSAFLQNIFADGEADALLLLVADERKMGVEEVVCGVAVALGAEVDHIDQHVGEGVPVMAIGSALHLEVEEEAAVAAQDGDGAERAGVLEEAEGGDFSRPGQSSCLSMTQEGLSVTIWRMTLGSSGR